MQEPLLQWKLWWFGGEEHMQAQCNHCEQVDPDRLTLSVSGWKSCSFSFGEHEWSAAAALFLCLLNYSIS